MSTQPEYLPIGTRVVVVDGSEAHGDEGAIWHVANGLCLIELDAGCIWVVSDPSEITPVDNQSNDIEEQNTSIRE